MSGEANAWIQGDLYVIALGSGVSVSVAGDPGEDFAREAVPLRAWLERAKPAIDALFKHLVAVGEPIVPYAQTFEEVAGTFLEEGDAGAFAMYHRGAPLMVRLSARDMPDGRSLNVAFLVSRRVERARMEAIVERIAEVVRAVG